MAQEPLTPFGNALAGALGGVFSNAVIYPLDTVKTRIQAGQQSEDSPNPKKLAPGQVSVRKNAGLFEGVLTIAKSKEGVLGLYKGFGASMVNTFSTQFAYFYWYTVVRTLYLRRATPAGGVAPTQIATAVELLLGAIAGGLAQIFTIPVSVIATRQQLASPSGSGASSGKGSSSSISTSSSSSNSTSISKSNSSTTTTSKAVVDPLKKVASKITEDDSFIGVAKDILREDGVTGLWRGLKPSLVLTVNPAITYGVFERVKGIILAASKDGKMTPWKSFLVGAVSKTLATIVTFPYILSKIRLQAKNSQYKGAFDVLGKIHREQGIAGWYQGMQAQITKAVLSQALLFYFRDYFEIWTRQLLKKK